MCWNAEVSLQSFLIGIGATFVAYQKGLSFPTTLFCLTIVFMQLIEYFVWTYYNNPTVNFVASLSASLLLWLQPLASILTLQTKWVLGIVLLYLGLSMVGFLLFTDLDKLCETYQMKRAENGHLQWTWLQKDTKTTVSLVFYFIFLLTPLLLQGQYVLLSLALSTLGLSLYSFYKENTWGSMWCWLVNYLVVGTCGYQIVFRDGIKN
jgi:hypothetical protein